MKIELSMKQWTMLLQLIEIISDQVENGEFGKSDENVPLWQDEIQTISGQIEGQAQAYIQAVLRGDPVEATV